MIERRKDKARRKLYPIVKVLELFCRQKKPLDPKQIGPILRVKPRWAEEQIRKFKRAFL